ncbi:hexokinase-domain-containing protein [Spinellus fusiger]|nr:hexokinase-domain-containing protein [Spinellus fusiger]
MHAHSFKEAVPVVEIGGSDAQEAFLQEVAKEFTLSTEQLLKIQDHFMGEMQKGLDQEGHTLAMIPSFVEGHLSGHETGQFLALDLGGTNLRVVLVTLEGEGKYKILSSKAKITTALQTGPIRDLCDFIAEFIDTFLTEQGLDEKETQISLGYTFSFPVFQTSINRGLLSTWTKGYACTGAIGKDPVILLQDALLRKHIPVKISALVNDTVGTLLSNAYNKPRTLAGLILGTGSNGAYIEQVSKIGKWKGGPTESNEMTINMEFGAFDNERMILPLTRYDNRLDRESINPHSQIFEKTISGMYLGEIVRIVLTDMIDRELLFRFKGEFNPNAWSKELSTNWSFETSFMSNIEADDTDDLIHTKEVLDSNLSLTNLSIVECKIIKRVCELVGTRAARLAATAVAAIVKHCGIPEEGVEIGIDGSLFEFYPSFRSRMYVALSELLPEHPDIQKAVTLSLTKDGSGVGAALTACVAEKMAKAAKK